MPLISYRLLLSNLSLIIKSKSSDVKVFETALQQSRPKHLGMVLVSPSIPIKEDDTFIKRHNSTIRSELAKTGKRNETVLNHLVQTAYIMTYYFSHQMQPLHLKNIFFSRHQFR